MANVTLWGASYSAVPALDVPKTGGGTARFTDVTDTTAVAGDVVQGKYFYLANGTKVEGTATSSGGSVTQDANGYIILPSAGGGGGSSYTLLGTEELTVSTTSTSTIDIADSEMSMQRASHTAKMLYIQVRDKAGKRNGYFYGSDTYWRQPVSGSALNDYRQQSVYVTNSSGAVVVSSTSQYGVFPTSPPTFSSGTVTITMRARYNSSYSTTVDGTYVVKVYDLGWPNDESPFV